MLAWQDLHLRLPTFTMKQIAVVFAFAFLSIAAYSQQNSKLYRAKMILNSNESRTGIVVGLSDSAIQIIKIAEAKSGSAQERLTAEWIPITSIRELRFRKLNALKYGIISGAAVGLVVGGVIGNATYQPCDDTPGWLGSDCDFHVMDRGASTLFGAIMGIQIGGGIGLIVGTANKKYMVNGSQQTYQKIKGDLDGYVLRER
jgi:hypothetical protein